jgi:hypothetical protein
LTRAAAGPPGLSRLAALGLVARLAHLAEVIVVVPSFHLHR